ncbi:MAG: protein disulfide isomerase family protein [Candidatus Marinimicrobia bacterium]|nr:protein disulfide isomerase family protein [Candidatus Neomarinimicrobiota bacterium]
MEKYVNFNQALPIGGEGIMSKIQNAGSSLSGTTITIIGVVILFTILAALYYFYYLSPQINAKYKPNSEHVASGSQESKDAELLFFYADWCPHCKTAKPIWNDLKAEYENKTINGYRVVFTEVNCSEETAEVDRMMNQYNVEGYPTIKLIKDGQVIEYDAKPSKDTLNQFLNTVL